MCTLRMNGSRKRFTAYDTQSYYFIKNKPSCEHKVPLLVLPSLLIFSLAFFFLTATLTCWPPSPFGGGLPSRSLLGFGVIPVSLFWTVFLLLRKNPNYKHQAHVFGWWFAFSSWCGGFPLLFLVLSFFCFQTEFSRVMNIRPLSFGSHPQKST